MNVSQGRVNQYAILISHKLRFGVGVGFAQI